MNAEKLNQLIDLADKYDYKPCASHFHNLSVFVGQNASLVSDLCKKYQALQMKLDALSAKAMELCEEAAHVYQKLNDSAAPDLVCDGQTIHELGLLASSSNNRTGEQP